MANNVETEDDPRYFKESANTLFHFMGKFEFLEMAIKSLKLFPRYNTEDVHYLGLTAETDIFNIALPMLCFCDINLHQIQNHISGYGSFGIGISKKWGSDAYGIQPINYINQNSYLKNDMKKGLNRIFSERLKDLTESDIEKANALLTQLKFSKPLYGKMLRRGETNFHDEHEWRYIPKIVEKEAFGILYDGSDYYKKWMNEESLNRLSNMLRGSNHEYGLVLDPHEINYIFVENDTFIPKIIEDIDSLNIEFKDKQILMTKIINLDQLERDW